MINQILRIFKKEYQTLNRIEISKENLLHNYKYLSSINRKVKIAPVIKSNAYGHGIIEVARILDKVGAPFFCVDSLYEAYELLKANIKTPILIMGYTNPENFKVKKLPFSFAVFDIKTAEALNRYQPDCKVHIFVDTGMRREGVAIDELPQFLNQLKQLKNLKIKGLMSHLASADDLTDPLNKIQINNFKKALALCKRQGIKPKWIHFSNSYGLLNYVPKHWGIQNMARVGLALYGIARDPNLKPVLKLISHIGQIKTLRKGEKTGYNGTFVAKKDMTIAILPIGFNDGVDKRLSNKGVVKIADFVCPIIGQVSMNITTIDITKVINPKIRQEVVVYSDNPNDKNSIINVAKICETIAYDLIVNLFPSIKRIVI